MDCPPPPPAVLTRRGLPEGHGGLFVDQTHLTDSRLLGAGGRTGKRVSDSAFDPITAHSAHGVPRGPAPRGPIALLSRASC